MFIFIRQKVIFRNVFLGSRNSQDYHDHFPSNTPHPPPTNHLGHFDVDPICKRYNQEQIRLKLLSIELMRNLIVKELYLT